MSLTKIGSIGINTGIAFAGVTTIVTLNTANDALSIGATVNVGSGITLGASGDIFATGVSTFSGNLKVGSGVTISPDGDGFYTGVVTATSYAGSGANLTGIDTDLVSDTSPQLGGNLDVNTKNIVFGDSGGATDDRLTFGAGTDLSIYHNGSDSYIEDSGTGALVVKTSQLSIRNAADDEQLAKFIQDSAVELYHNNSKKFDTDSEGISITGTVKINNTSSVGDYNGGADDMLIGTHSGNHGLTILSGTSNGGYIMFSDNNGGGTNAYRGQIEYAHSSDYMRFITDSGERVRILSGGGITFNGDTATANALDDYEEGSFTPAFGGGISASSYHNQYGFYTKTGDQVYAYIYLRANSASTGSANVTVTGLPLSLIHI